MFRFILSIVFLLILAGGPVAAQDEQSMALDPETGLIRKVVAGSNQINAFEKPDASSPVKYTLDLLQPYYLMGEEGEFFKITTVRALTQEEAESGEVGYVLQEQVYEWPTREALHFLPFTLTEDRNPIEAWDEKDEVRKFFESGDKVSHAPTFQEDIKSTLAREGDLRPYPVMDSFETSFMGRTEKRIYEVLLPATITPQSGLVLEDESDAQKMERALGRVTFNVVFDATASMADVAEEVANELVGAIDQLGAEGLEDSKIGFVFYRDEEDEEPSLIVPARSVAEAANFLKDYATRMVGGGDAAEPVLDAIYMSAELFDWTAGDAQSGSRRVAIIVLNDDAKSRTTGAIDSRVPANQTPAEIGQLLVENRIIAITVQAGENAGPNLKGVLQRVADLTGGAFVPWGSDLGADVGGAIKNSVLKNVEAAKKDREDIVAATEFRGGKAIIPLRVLDGEKLDRLREAGIKFNIDNRKGGILVRRGYLPENTDLLDPQIRIEKDTLQRLLNLFSVLSSTTMDAEDLRVAVQENIAAMAGERPDPSAEIASVVRNKLGIKFRTPLLSFSIDYLTGLNPKERLALQARIKEAADRLSDFLDARARDFDVAGAVWMPVGFLP